MQNMRWGGRGHGHSGSHHSQYEVRFPGRRGKRHSFFRIKDNHNVMRFDCDNTIGFILAILAQATMATTVIVMAWLTLVSPSNFGRVEGGVIFGAFAVLSVLSMWSHAAVALSDPGYTTEDIVPILKSHGEMAVALSSAPIAASGSPAQVTSSNGSLKIGAYSLEGDGAVLPGKKPHITGVLEGSLATSPPAHAIPADAAVIPVTVVCSQCNYYKPPRSHHCRVCRRCIVS